MNNNSLQLNPAWQKRYRVSRFFVYLIFALAVIYAAYLILFPSANFTFSFKNPDSSKNTIVDPRGTEGNIIKSGRPDDNGKMIFDTNPLGNFSEVELDFTLAGASEKIDSGTITVRKSYRSFFYPEGPETNAPENTDLPKLLSANNSVFIASQGKVWPIADAVTFVSMGWSWNDVSVSNSEEIGNYEKQKLFTLKTPHPDGTIFYAEDSGKYYLVENGQRYEISDIANFRPFMKINPVTASDNSLEIKASCNIEKSFSLFQKYKCLIPIQEMQNLPGNDYQFEANFGNGIKISDMAVTFKKTLNLENLKSSLSTLKSRATANYYGNNQ